MRLVVNESSVGDAAESGCGAAGVRVLKSCQAQRLFCEGRRGLDRPCFRNIVAPSRLPFSMFST